MLFLQVECVTVAKTRCYPKPAVAPTQSNPFTVSVRETSRGIRLAVPRPVPHRVELGGRGSMCHSNWKKVFQPSLRLGWGFPALVGRSLGSGLSHDVMSETSQPATSKHSAAMAYLANNARYRDEAQRLIHTPAGTSGSPTFWVGCFFWRMDGRMSDWTKALLCCFLGHLKRVCLWMTPVINWIRQTACPSINSETVFTLCQNCTKKWPGVCGFMG